MRHGVLNEGLKQALMDFLGERFSEAGGVVTLSPANERELAAVLKLLRERKGRLHLDARLSRERLGGHCPQRAHRAHRREERQSPGPRPRCASTRWSAPSRPAASPWGR